jgi:hypothetical protein
LIVLVRNQPITIVNDDQSVNNSGPRKLNLDDQQWEALERMRQVLNEADPPLDGSSILTLKAMISNIIRNATEEFFKVHNVVDDPDFWDK